MNNPKISVIVPVYNVEKYLRRCIDSILSQTFSDFELLLIDDGSKDNSGKICDNYALKNQRVKVFHNSNQGASAARNFGLSKAKGEYVSFIDSDDWMESTYYEDFFGKDDFQYDIYFQNYVLHKADGEVEVYDLNPITIKNRKGHNIDEAILYLMKEVKFGWSWIKLFKRSILEKNNIIFAEDICLREDEIFAFQYCKHINSICIRANANYHYYIYSTSLTRRFRDPLEYIRISRILREESSYIKANGICEYEDNYYLRNLYSSLLQIYVHGAQKNMTKTNRYKVINSFLDFYHNHKNINAIKYKSRWSRFMYQFLWYSKSAFLIDQVMQKWFRVKYKI